MRIGSVIGSVTLNRFHPLLRGAQWKLVVPLGLADLDNKEPNPKTEELVVYDQLGCGIGEWIAFSEGVEAAMPFFPNLIPIDAYNAAILDTVEIGESVTDDD
ncbi:MAG: EutN/CcmL family microcompartment protein [Thermoguttaceae bacterium]